MSLDDFYRVDTGDDVGRRIVSLKFTLGHRYVVFDELAESWIQRYETHDIDDLIQFTLEFWIVCLANKNFLVFIENRNDERSIFFSFYGTLT